MGMMGNERGRRGRQRERHSQGESRSTRGGGRMGGLIERGRHKVELELFFSFFQWRGLRERGRESCRMDEGEGERVEERERAG